MYAQYATIHETKRNETALSVSLSLPPSLPLHHSLAIFTGEGGSPGSSLPVVAVAISLFSVCLPRFIYLPYLYHTVLYPLPFPPLPPSITCHLGRISYQLPGPKLTHVSIHPSIPISCSTRSLARSLGFDVDVAIIWFSFLFFLYLFIYPLSLSRL